MNMSCKVVMDLVELYKEEIVSKESAESIRAHLKGCPDCRRFYRDFEATRRKQLLRSPALPQAEMARASGRCYTELSRRMRRHHYLRVAGASAAIGAGSIMLLIGIALTSRGCPSLPENV